MRCLFRLSKHQCQKIISAMKFFWWNACEKKRKIQWISWTEMCKSKENGGLSFRELGDFHQVLLAKQAWKIINEPDTLLSRIYKGRYFVNKAFLDCGKGYRVPHMHGVAYCSEGNFCREGWSNLLATVKQQMCGLLSGLWMNTHGPRLINNKLWILRWMWLIWSLRKWDRLKSNSYGHTLIMVCTRSRVVLVCVKSSCYSFTSNIGCWTSKDHSEATNLEVANTAKNKSLLMESNIWFYSCSWSLAMTRTSSQPLV